MNTQNQQHRADTEQEAESIRQELREELERLRSEVQEESQSTRAFYASRLNLA